MALTARPAIAAPPDSPSLKQEICEFWQDRLKALPDGTLVAPNGYSPEHGPREDGVSHDQQLIWDVFPR